MNFFSTEPFLQALSAVYFKSSSSAVARVNIAGQTYQLLCGKRGHLSLPCPFVDFLESLAGQDNAMPSKRGYLPRVVVRDMPRSFWHQDRYDASVIPAPYIQWSHFGTWGAFLAHAATNNPLAFRLSARKIRKLERECGPLCVVHDLHSQEVLHTCLDWKSAQYRSTGVWDVFAVQRHREFFEELLRRRIIQMSGLFAGDRLLAVHVGALWQGRFYYWMPAHDPTANHYSPGTLLLEALLHRSFTSGDQQFDFLIGGESYKWNYATDVRLIGPVGEAPWLTRAWRPLRSWLLGLVRGWRPDAYRWLQGAKRRLREF